MLILPSTVTVSVSISAFALLACVFADITSSVVGIKYYTITAGIEKYKSIIKKKKKKHDKIVLLGKSKLDTIKVLISKPLIDSYINQNKFLLVNNVSREYNEKKEEIKNLETFVKHTKKYG